MDFSLALQGRTSTIFKLPPELRCQIYEEVLVSNTPILLNAHQEDSLFAPPPPPALLRTCRTIRHESQPIYYSQNTFVARPWTIKLDPLSEREAIVEFLSAWLIPLKIWNCLHSVRHIDIVNDFWFNLEALPDIKAVNFALAEHGVAVATDVLRAFIKWDDDFGSRAITNSNWLEVGPQWESWASILRRIKAEEGERPKYLNEAAAHSAWVHSMDLRTPASNLKREA